MFTDKAQMIIDLAKDYAYASNASTLDISPFLTAMISQSEARILLAECFKITPKELKDIYPISVEPVTCPTKLPLSENLRNMFNQAKSLASEVPDRFHPGLIDIRHLVCATALTHDACSLLKLTPITHDEAISFLTTWIEQDSQTPGLEDLSEKLRTLRSELLKRVFGQDHAIHAFVEGLFNAEVVAVADTQRKRPQAIFVFAGPPGVGKTFLAELGASYLDRPFKRFDMSAYSGHQQDEQLVGMAKSFHAAHPGTLTEFVEKNPNALLLFDEIEKAHIKTIQLFLQLLDNGTLEDKYHERNVVFRDTIIIFTTNAGKKLYDRPNISGVHSANATFHRKTILDALENEKNPLTGEPFFPQSICSRIATGYPILFNHLSVNELDRVVQAELNRMSDLIELQYYKQTEFDDYLSMCLVLREGSKTDARTVRSQTELFLKTELFKFCQLFKTESLEDVLKQVDKIKFCLDKDLMNLNSDIQELFDPQELPSILLVASESLTQLYKKHISKVNWITANSTEDIFEVLANREVDMVLIDLFIKRKDETPSKTIEHFDHIPIAAKGLEQGQELLRKIHERLPHIPIYLLSIIKDQRDISGTIDEELFLACVRAGGARGMILSSFTYDESETWKKDRDQFLNELKAVHNRLYREKVAAKLGQERKVLSFDTAPDINKKEKEITIRLRNLQLSRAIASSDVGEVLEDVERPRTRFDDVIGAKSAKEELQFFINYLKNPRRFAALGLKPPKGVLLHGPPGTGKTMLARAMAGESNVAFISASASNFVTIWQGSGPQNVRDLFERARRYAPSIIFIDEIDAIGRVRTGSAGGSQATENTLNALFTEMDGFTSPSPERPVFILAATNFKVDAHSQDSPERSLRTLDPALVRRFSRTILVDLPDREARLQYLKKRLEGRAGSKITENGMKLIAERSPGMSIANLELIIETAARNSAKEGKQLTDQALEDAFETVSFGERKMWNPEDVKRTARHEAGHTIMYWLSGWWPPYVTIVSRGHFGGYMTHSSDEIEKQFGDTKEQLLAKIRVSLGGRGAELIYYGKEEGLTTGASSDFQQATRIARHMIAQYGMDEEQGPLVTSELLSYESALSGPEYQILNQKAGKILKEQMEQTINLLEENKDLLESIVSALAEKERLTQKELQEILPPMKKKLSNA
ncbi:MAG: AAA family ATPase [bacterium]